MKKFILLILVSFLTSCSSTEEPSKNPDFKGYVIKINERGVLITSKYAEQNDAIWFSDVKENLSVGDYVEGIIDGPIKESYPAQAKAKKIYVHKDKKPDSSFHSQRDVLRMAIEEHPDAVIIIVNDVMFNKEKGSWSVQLSVDGKEVYFNLVEN